MATIFADLSIQAGCKKGGENKEDVPKSSPRSTIDEKTGAAKKVHVAGLRTQTMNYYAAEQAQSNWCWAACIQMLLSTRGITAPQAEVVRRAFGTTADVPATPEVIVRNLDGLQIHRAGRSLRLTTTIGLGPPPLEVLVNSLRQDVPVLITLKPDTGEIGHAMIVTAVVYEDTPTGPRLCSVMVRDPAQCFRNTMGKRKLNPEELGRISAYLRLSELALPE